MANARPGYGNLSIVKRHSYTKEWVSSWQAALRLAAISSSVAVDLNPSDFYRRALLALSRIPRNFTFVIKLIDIHKAFGPKKVLEGFSLEVDEGQTMVIVGYSGTGKSVAIKHIVGLLEPDQGTVWVDGQEVPTLTRPQLYALRANIGYVFQFAALFDSLNIGDNVAMGLRKEGKMSEKEIMTP